MNKNTGKIVILIVLLLALIGGIVFFIVKGKDNSVLVKNISVVEKSCEDDVCKLTLKNENGEDTYILDSNVDDFFTELSDYKDNIRIDIYYKNKNKEKKIADYKIYLKENNKELNVKSEKELREELGLYLEGIYTETLTFVKSNEIGVSYSNGVSTLYYDYIFSNKNNMEFSVRYFFTDKGLDLLVGKEYNVTFEVSVDSIFNRYRYTLKEIN